MAAEADRVVVELIAKVDNFDSTVKQSATSFSGSMSQIEASAGKAEKAHTRLTLQGNNTRIAMAELGHVARGASDQLAAGAPLTQILTQHMAQLGQAAGYAGAGMGALGSFLGGPWGIAITLATVVLTKLILKHQDTGHEVDALVEKMRKHVAQAGLNDQANAIWARSLDGVVEAHRKLREEIEKQIKTPEIEHQQNVETTTRQFAEEQARLRRQREELAAAQRDLAARAAKVNVDPNAFLARRQTDPTLNLYGLGPFAQKVEELKKKVAETQKAVADGASTMLSVGIPAARDYAAANSDGAKAIGQLYDAARAKLEGAIGSNKKLADSLGPVEAALERARKAETTAESAGANIKGTGAQVANLTRSLAEGRIGPDAFTKAINAMAVALDKAAEAAKKAKKETGDANRQFGKQVSFGDAQRIAESAGFTVTSAQRSTARQAQLFNDPNVNRPGNPVAPPGSSAHEGAKGKWALDIAFAPGLTAGKIKKVFADEGVSLSATFKESGHFHIEGSRSQAASADAEQARAAAEAKRAADKELNQRRAAGDAIANAQQDELAARQSLLTSAQEIDALEKQAILIAQKRNNDDLDFAVQQGTLDAGMAKELKQLADDTAKHRLELVDIRANQRAAAIAQADAQRQLSVETSSLDAQRELLDAQAGLATTAKERHELERRILDIVYQEEKLRLQNQIAMAQDVQANVKKLYNDQQISDAAASELDARNKLGTLDQRHSIADKGNDKQNQSPLQAYFGDIQSQTKDINSAFESIAAGGLATFTDALTNAIVNFTSLGDVGRAVLHDLAASLVKLAIQQVLNATIGKAIAAAGSAATIATNVATAAAVGAAWAGPAAAASLATLGANAAPAAAALTSTTVLATALAAPKAEGGPIEGPGGPTQDRVLIAASNGEYMIRTASARRLGRAALDHINRTGTMPGFANGGSIRPMNVAAISSGGGSAELSPASIAAFRGIVREAIHAMPDVKLIASIDPVESFQRALGSRAGEKVLLAALGRNRGGVRATIGS